MREKAATHSAQHLSGLTAAFGNYRKIFLDVEVVFNDMIDSPLPDLPRNVLDLQAPVGIGCNVQFRALLQDIGMPLPMR